ncbi:MAG: hypothetical protein ACRDHZ_08625 [Ktedonobacteraceae bacterium]
MEYPNFEIGPDGFPIAGQVIRYYREHMTYTEACVLTNSDNDRSYARDLLDKAEKYILSNKDNTFIRFDAVPYLECKSETLVALKRYQLALECIDETDDYTSTRPNIMRNVEYLKILRAECYIKQKKHEYEEALRILSQVLDTNKHIRYYVDYVTRLHKLIAASSYGNAPDVVDLGMTLRELRMK